MLKLGKVKVMFDMNLITGPFDQFLWTVSVERAFAVYGRKNPKDIFFLEEAVCWTSTDRWVMLYLSILEVVVVRSCCQDDAATDILFRILFLFSLFSLFSFFKHVLQKRMKSHDLSAGH